MNINEIHDKLQIKYGSFKEELPEQQMSVKYLKGDEKILEIGGNIGRNSLVISQILQNSENLVVLESDEISASQLKENRDLNNFNFHIENSALSKRKLIQNGWYTKPSEILENGFKWVNIIDYKELINKYDIIFDTLVLDCEGAFYYILIDMPEILDNINLIIMENDYDNLLKKEYVDDILKKHNFKRDFFMSGSHVGAGWSPCCDNFFEVWKKNK